MVTAEFSVASMMNAPLHGLALWFDFTFERPSITCSDAQSETSINLSLNDSSNRSRKCAKSTSLVLSTAPEEKPTHWAQTVLYIYDPIDVKQDQLIEGSITLSQNQKKSRFLNIHLEYASGGRKFVKASVLS